MKLGIALEGIRPVAEQAALAATIEGLGFQSLWAPDHIAYSQPIADPFQVLSVCAATTSRIVLGTCVYLLPLRHPTHVAKVTASFDWLCGGRFVLGIGVGGEFPGEFAACEVEVGERDARASQAIPIVRALWRGEEPPASRFFHVPPTPLRPAPARDGGPPIWVGGRSDAALQRAARLGDGYLGYFLDPDGIRGRMARIRELREASPAAARRAKPIACAVMAFVRVDREAERARSAAAHRLQDMYGSRTASVVDRFCIVGTLEDCQARAAAYRAAGVEHLLLCPIAKGGDFNEQLECCARLAE